MVQASTERPPPPRRYEVVLRFGTRSNVVALPETGVLGVGRSPDSSIRIDDPAVSRQHLELFSDGERVEVVDLGSSNGTLLLAQGMTRRFDDATAERLTPYRRCPLAVGESVRVGPAALTLKRALGGAGDDPALGPPVLLEPAMVAAYELIARAACTDLCVLVLGETGAGKELMAETLHARSPRRERRLLLLNCAALPEQLLESELFGHEQGAFTGAERARIGLLEATTGGTVFLDEIGELTLATQAKLLRVLEERRVLPVGATAPRDVDVRFISATNRDLSRLVHEGRFRADLYHRISGLIVKIPPLRERLRELEPLARHFLRSFCERAREPEPELSAAALAALQGHAWPGNVRELKNVMERAALSCAGGMVAPEHLALEGAPASLPRVVRLHDVAIDARDRDDPARRELVAAIEACAGNQTRAARLLGVSRQTLINRLVKWNLPRPQKR